MAQGVRCDRAGCRHSLLVLAKSASATHHRARDSPIHDAVVMDPWPELECMGVDERVPVAGVAVPADLELRLEADPLPYRNLASGILDEPWYRANRLGAQYPYADQDQFAACVKPDQASLLRPLSY